MADSNHTSARTAREPFIADSRSSYAEYATGCIPPHECSSPPCEAATLPAALCELIDGSVETAFSNCAFDAAETKHSRSTLPMEIERIRRPAAAYERREGQVLEAAIKATLRSSVHSYRYIGPITVPIWAAGRELCAANADADTSRWTVPASGLPTDSVAFDAVVVTADERSVIAIEIKRSPAAIPKGLEIDLQAGCLTLRHHLATRGIHVSEVRPLMICWYADVHGSRWVTRETVDETLGIPIRPTVEAALGRFRSSFSERYHRLIRDTARSIEEPAMTQTAPNAKNASALRFAAVFDEFAKSRRR